MTKRYWPHFLLALLMVCAFAGAVFAQDPGAAEDEREARLKLLKAADQVDMIQTNSESLRTEVDALKSQVTKMQDENTSLRQEVADLKSSLEKMDTARAREREVLLGEVGKMVATKPTSAVAETKKSEVDLPSVTKSEHGFYHVVEKGETLTLICQAYRDKGVKVTVADIRKANSLGPKNVLQVGQKLFIPKE
jgi:regulator of replication initiation timing